MQVYLALVLIYSWNLDSLVNLLIIVLFNNMGKILP